MHAGTLDKLTVVVKDNDPFCGILMNDTLHYTLVREEGVLLLFWKSDMVMKYNFFEEAGRCFWHYFMFIIAELSSDEPMQVTYTKVSLYVFLRLVYLLLY